MSTLTSPRIRPKQLVTLPPDHVTPQDAQAHYERKLAFETDPADVYHDMNAGIGEFVIVDARQEEAYQACRVPGAIHFPHGRMRPSTTRALDPSALYITYCWGPGCNGSTRAAARLSELGFKVREMIGGIEYWQREGYPIEGTEATDATPVAS